jgi:hypothetical protein
MTEGTGRWTAVRPGADWPFEPTTTARPQVPGAPSSAGPPVASRPDRGSTGSAVPTRDDGTAATGPEPDRHVDPVPDPPARDPRPRRRRVRPLVLGSFAAVVVLGGIVGAGLGLLADRTAVPTGEPVVLPSPTPTVAPVARTPVSAFADSLPATVLRYALTAQVEHPPLLAQGAVEGYRLDYSDGGTGTVTVLAGQWPTPEDAAAAYAAATAGAAPVDDGEPASGDVVVAGAVVGTWSVAAAADGAATVTWSNGTAVLQVLGPADVVRDVYAAYPY